MENQPKKALPVIPLILVAVFLLIAVGYGARERLFGALTPTQSARYALFGTLASPSTLTTSFTAAGSVSSTPRLVKNMPNIVVAGTYTPYSHGSVLQILVERSIDDGSTFEPYNLLEAESGAILVHTSSTTGMPFIIPGDGMATSGTAQEFSFDLTLAADYIRISAREITTSTAGTVFAKLYFQSQ